MNESYLCDPRLYSIEFVWFLDHQVPFIACLSPSTCVGEVIPTFLFIEFAGDWKESKA